VGEATAEAITEASAEASTAAAQAFYALVAIFFLLFDRAFTERSAGYMDVPDVLKATEVAFRALLEGAHGSTSAQDLLEAHVLMYGALPGSPGSKEEVPV